MNPDLFADPMRRVSLVVIVAVVVAGCLGGTSGDDEDGPVAPGLRYGFSPPVVATPDGAGSEPGIMAARDGAIYIVSVLGSADARGDGLWRSEDDGRNWTYLGMPDYPFGGGDSDIDEDEAGTLYVPGQWRGAALPVYIAWGESVAVSKDRGQTWTVNPIASDSVWTDRQWLATHGTGTAYLAFNQIPGGLMVTKSTDSGLTWTQARLVPGTGGPNGIPGDILVDPEDGTLYIPYAPGIGGSGGTHRLIVSGDGGETFEARPIHTSAENAQSSAIFGSLDQDEQRRLYYAWSEGSDATGMRVWVRWSDDGGLHWSDALQVSENGTTAVMPWLTVGTPGRIAIGYYGANGTFRSDAAPEDTEWRPIVTFIDDALMAPRMEHHTLSPTPNHVGPLCTGGTGCDPQYRLLGDFFEIDLTTDGRVVAVWVDDTVTPRVNVVAVQERGSLNAVDVAA